MKERILIVDDNQRNITVLGTILHQEHYQLNIAMDGIEALEMVKKVNPDLILLDVMMPNLDGYGTCEKLKADPQTSEIPIIFLTAKTQLEDRVKGLDLGAVDYVTKPFETRELLSRVRTHLELKRHKDLLKVSNQRNLELLHMLCHDIANPLSLIIGYLSLLKESPDRFESYQNVLNSAAENGLEIIEIARKMLSLDKEGIELHPVRLDKAVERAISLQEHKFKEKEITIHAELKEFWVKCDESSLVNSVISNILTNAIKFSLRGSSLYININSITPEFVTLNIRDHGIGMPKAILDNLFNINYKVNRPGTEDETGTGFGMPLIKKFMDAYGGKIEVKSRDIDTLPDKSGSLFIFNFQKTNALPEG